MPRLIPTALPYVSTQSTFLSWTLHTFSELEIVLIVVSISRAVSASCQREENAQKSRRGLTESGVKIGRGLAAGQRYPYSSCEGDTLMTLASPSRRRCNSGRNGG